MSSGGRRKWRWFGVGVLAVGGAVFAAAALAERNKPHVQKVAAPAEKPAVAVTVEPVAVRPVRRVVTAVGSLYGRDEVTLSPKVEGRVLKIHRDMGDVVKPGETLLEIDPVDHQLAVAEARRAFDLELAKLGLKELPAARFDVAALPSVAKAAAQERQATLRWNRVRQLAGGRSVSAEENDRAEADLAVARADHQQAMLEAEAILASARHRLAVLDSAQQRLKDTRVVVPGTAGSGTEYVVCQRAVSEGEIVHAMPAMPGMNTTLFKLVIDRTLKLQATIPERHRAEVKIGLDAELEVEAYPGEKFAGKVTRVNPSVDRTSRTFQAEIHVPNPDRRLSPGSFAKVAILTRTGATARTVPEEAIVTFAGVTKVFAVRDGQSREVPVRTGVTVHADSPARTWVEVEGDLQEGEKVVTSGQSQLAQGTAVRVR